MTRQPWRLALLAGLATLAACGGGGGDGDAGDPVLPQAAAPITAANYEGVAQQTVAASSYLGDSAGLVSGAQVAPSARLLIAFSRAQVGRLPGLMARATPLVTGATTTETLPCTGGGSLSVTTNDANNNNRADAGDSARMTASNCVEAGATLNGGLALSFTAASGDLESDTFSATVSITLENLRASAAAGNVSGNGSFTLAITSTDANTFSLVMTTERLAMTGQFAGVTDTVALQDWRQTSATALSGGRLRTETTLAGLVVGSNLAPGRVTVSTLVPLVQFADQAFPVSGQLAAEGAANSRLRMTVQGTGNVLVELDANGDGTYEASAVKSWASLV